MRYLLLVAGLLVISACTSIDPTATPEALYDDAVAAYEAEQPVRAYRLLHAASDAGSFNADFHLARFYGYGELAGASGAVPADPIIAFNTFWGGWAQDEERAKRYQAQGSARVEGLAEAGDLTAMTELALAKLYDRDMTWYGMTAPHDVAEARRLLEAASAQGHAEASFILWASPGELDLAQDEREAYLARAEAQDHAHSFAMYTTILMSKNPLAALTYLEQRASEGHAEAPRILERYLTSLRDEATRHAGPAEVIAAWDAGTRS
ncbi:MAG: hypothetical protein AAGJ10_18290 [Bacteroidota bacterium]